MTAAERIKLYDEIQAVRYSQLKEILKSPAHYFHALNNPREQTPAMAAGERLHKAILEPESLENFAVAPECDRRTKEGKETWAKFQVENEGKTIISDGDYNQMIGVTNAVLTHPTANRELLNGEAEIGIHVPNFASGLDVKSRFDFIRVQEGVIVDVKTTKNASFKGFQKEIADYKMHMQAALYLDMASRYYGREFKIFRIIAVEKEAPYAVAIYELDFGTLEKGRELYQFALHCVSECEKLNHWPSYPEHVTSISIPHWAFNEGHE